MSDKGETAQETGEDNEANFPGKAESEDEDCNLTENGENGSKERQDLAGMVGTLGVQHSISDDMSCVVCSEVLVDPCSLRCGHSFCLLCLANLWKSKAGVSSRLQCPVCRNSWGSNYPGINIQLRNIIQRQYGALVESRRKEVSDEDRALLQQYGQARMKSLSQERTAVPVFQHRWVYVMFILILIFSLIAVCAVIVLATTMTGPDGEYMRKPVDRWMQEDVMSWVGALGNWAHHNVSHALQKEKITGPQLLMLDQAVLKSFGIDQKFQVDSLLMAIQKLKEQKHCTPRDFNEFLAAHRRTTLILAVLYKLWPRFSFVYAYVFEYYDVFLPLRHCTHSYSEEAGKDPLEYPSNWQLKVFKVEMFLVPHYLVGMCAWYWSSVHPWLAAAILVHCMYTTQQEAKHIFSYLSARHAALWYLELLQLLRRFFANALVCVVVVLLLYSVWPLVPYFLCDWALHIVMWHTALLLASKPFKLLPLRRVQRVRRPQVVMRHVRQDIIP